MPFESLIGLNQCQPSGGTFVAMGDLELAVIRLPDTDEVVVLNNTCPHAGGNLSGGEVTGCTVTCPWHEWEFDLKTGQCVHSPKARVTRYPCQVREGVVYVDPSAPY